MGQAIDALARHVAETRPEDIPEAVRRHARLVLLDTLGVILAGSEQPEVRGLRERLGRGAGSGATILARGWPAADPRTAALLNGTAGRSIELCESHRFVACQAAVQVLPGVLAVAEGAGRDGRELLTAFILGYDVAIRLGAGVMQRPLAHQNGQTALLGAVAGGARLRGLNAAQIGQALRIGATFVLTPSYTNAVAGATTLNAAGGMSGLAASLVPEMALAGFQGQEDAVEEAFAQLVGDGFSMAPVTEDLGERWEVTRNAFRLRACCIPIYAALDAIEAAVDALGARPDEIDRIDVRTYRFASAMRARNPVNAFAARYSLPHAAAALILRGDAGHGSFTEAALADPAIQALRQRVQVEEDPVLTAMFPRAKPARVTVTLRDGRATTQACDSPRGDFQHPYREEEIRKKFRDLAELVLPPVAVAAVETLIEGAEKWRATSDLTDALRRYSALGPGD